MKTNALLIVPVIVTVLFQSSSLAQTANFTPRRAVDTPTPTGVESTNQTQLIIMLNDGSRLIGTTTLNSLPVRSEALGKLEIPLAKVRTIEFSRDHESLTVELVNGDSLQGGLGKMTLRLRTLFGEIAVPVEQIVAINIRSGTLSLEEFDPSKPYGLQFDGRQNYVAVPSDASFDPAEAMTVECWVKTTSRSDQAILGKRQWGSRPDHGYQLHISGGRLVGYWNGHVLNGNSLNDGQWHHVALTWDGEHRRLFQDGVKTAEDAPGAWTPCECEFLIGGIDGTDNGDPRDFFEGAISEVRLSKVDRYKGQNFTPARRSALDKDIVGYWKLTEGSGTLIHDQSDNGHEGTLQGNPPPRWISGESR